MHEHKGDEPKKDEWGNYFRPPMDLKPFQIKKGCECPDHTMLCYSIETEVVTVDQREALIMMFQGQQPPTEIRWVPILHIKMEHN